MTAISLLFVWLTLEILFSVGGAMLLILRRTDAPPSGRRMRLFWAAMLLISIVPLRVLTPAASVTIVEESSGESVRIEFTEYATPTPAQEISVENLTSSLPAPPEKASSPVTLRLRASAADAVQILLTLLCSVWLIGAAAALISRLAELANTAALLRAHSAPCTDARLLGVYRTASAGLGIKNPPPLRIFKDGVILSPCSCGLFFPSVCVSDAQHGMSDDALTLVLTHELAHIRARDALLSLLSALACSVHWMNPLCEKITRAAAEDCELAADETVLRIYGEEIRLPYIHAILDIASGVTAYAAGAGSFGAASENAEFIKRRYDCMKNKKSRRLTTALALTLTVLLLFSNMLSLSSCDANSAADSPKVTLANPVLANALADYFGVSADALTEYHMSLVTSLEILPAVLTDPAMKESTLTGLTPVRIRINGGVIPTDAGEMTVPSIGAPYDDGFVFESLPLMGDTAAMDAMFAKIEAVSEWNSMKFKAFYTLKDASPEYLQAAAYDMLVSLFCENTTAARNVTENGEILDVNGDGSITVKDVELIGSQRSLVEAEKIVAALPEDVRSAYIAQYTEEARAAIKELFPYAEARPMYLIDPEAKPRETAQLLSILHECGLLEGRMLTGTAVDLADTALMPNLTTVKLSDGFTAVNLPE